MVCVHLSHHARMDLKVEISGRETIKPLSATPAHRKFHNLTILDQTTPSAYVPVCLFYPSHGETVTLSDTNIGTTVADTLKTSLSQTLDAYYPLAGRYKDARTIECNDEGVEFLEACVAGDMSDAFQRPDEDRLLALLPCLPRERHVDSGGELFLLAVQLNSFECGGVAIGICMWHGVADACTLACFLRAWATINNSRGCTSSLGQASTLVDGAESTAQPLTPGSVVVDCTSIFPPTRVNAALVVDNSTPSTPHTKVKRFVFEGFQIAALRSGIKSYWQQEQGPTRVEAVSALIWAAVIGIARDKKKPPATISSGDEQDLIIHCYHVGMMVVNLRSRMVPPLPEQVMGNLVHVPVLTKWPISYEKEIRTAEGENELLRAQLAEKLRKSVGMVNDENVRTIFRRNNDDDNDKGPIGHAGYSDLFKLFVEEHHKGNLVAFSSWCRFPFYEADFGWGKPTLVGYFNMMDNLVLLIDAKDGEGMEAWVSLGDEDMYKFQNDHAILQYADFIS